MITKQQRIEQLNSLLSTLKEICSKYDLRLGQVITITHSRNFEIDLFNIENDKLEALILKELS